MSGAFLYRSWNYLGSDCMRSTMDTKIQRNHIKNSHDANARWINRFIWSKAWRITSGTSSISSRNYLRLSRTVIRMKTQFKWLISHVVIWIIRFLHMNQIVWESQVWLSSFSDFGDPDRLNSGNIRICDPREWNLNLNSSDCSASKIISNDKQLETNSWEVKIENPFLNFCVGV